jgi:predicted phosphodiesterase
MVLYYNKEDKIFTMIGFLGDTHGNFDILFERMEQHKEIDTWVQVGDFGDEKKSYRSTPKLLYFISGNHENWNELEKMDKGVYLDNLYHIGNGEAVNISMSGIKILGFGGNYSPSYYYKKRKDICGERRRHFVEEDFNRAKDFASQNIDIMISHEAPSPYMKGNRNMGQPIINELLKIIKPKLYLFGHHHYDSISEYEGIPSIGLGFGLNTFVKFNSEDFSYKRMSM